MAATSLRQGMEGDLVVLGEAPSERTYTLAWSGELRKGGREERRGERENASNQSYTCCVHHALIKISVSKVH